MDHLHTVLSERLRRSAGNKTGLPDRLKSGIEALSGFSMDPVRVHFNSPKPARLRAYAYARGTDIHVAPGQEKYLPHEAWHVVQQMQGRVSPTDRINGTDMNDSGALEREADIMGAKAAGFSAAPTAALREKSLSGGAAQLVPHVTVRAHDDYAAVRLVPSEKPTIVFEAMSARADDARRIFDETRKYSGNTILVFGLNRRDQMPEERVNIPDAPPHFFRSFAFQWSKPFSGGGENRYVMPFIEARKAIMDEAAEVVEKTRELDAFPHDNPAGRFIYRWIDGDAADDQSEQIPSESLALLTDGGLSVLSGTYKWRTGSPEKEAYLAFIKRINAAEKLLRLKFFEMYGKLSNDFNYESALPSFVVGEGGLGDYYLPETSLMMSEEAHRAIRGGDYGRYINQEQSKESMKMLSGANISSGSVAFERSFSISKPLKGEFSPEGENYLGIDFLNMLKRGDGCTFDDFYGMLCKMRQSVFEKFKMDDRIKFPSGRSYAECKIGLAQQIYHYFIEHRAEISRDLSDVHSRRR